MEKYNKFIDVIKKNDSAGGMINFLFREGRTGAALDEARRHQTSLNGTAGPEIALIVAVLEGVKQNPHKTPSDYIENGALIDYITNHVEPPPRTAKTEQALVARAQVLTQEAG